MSEAAKRPVGRPVTTGTTPKRSIRIPDDLWTGIAEAAQHEGTDVAGLTRDFYAWYLRRPDAKLPKRPQAGPPKTSTESALS
jgi:hypothetical protein